MLPQLSVQAFRSCAAEPTSMSGRVRRCWAIQQGSKPVSRRFCLWQHGSCRSTGRNAAHVFLPSQRTADGGGPCLRVRRR